MKAYLTCLFLVTLSFGIYGKIPAGSYYHKASFNIENGVSPKLALFKAINQHTVLSYKQARRHLFGRLHLEKTANGSYTVKDVYCRKDVGENYGVGPDRIPNNTIMNCEHTWPQSRFNKQMSKTAQKTDLHHLFPSDSKANSSRGNLRFGAVNGRDAHNNCSSSQRGSDILSSGTSFEPPVEHRGNVARALFYFSVRYQIKITRQEETHLREWHLSDPVDDQERQRNEEIYAIQGNRNPFIDEPTAVDDISDF
jgi:deoxyribonuclease-1